MSRVLALCLCAAMFFSAAGCAALFDREIYTEELYEAPSETVELDGDADAISSYAALRRAITRLVSEHAESAELQFQNYDGSISQDISTACWEVKSSTAMGAFAVDYISYDLSRIVSYYQAEIYITYKRSEYQMSLLEQTENLAAMRARIGDAVRSGETYVLMQLTAASLTGETVARDVEQAYYADPLACPVLPGAEAAVYPETGVTRIVEVTLDYGMDGESLALRRDELTRAVDAMVEECLVPAADPAEETDEGEAAAPAAEGAEAGPEQILHAVCAYISDRCRPDDSAGSTAWDALTAGAADSEGIAMAFKAGCDAAGIPCRIVFGRLDGRSHVWNIVTLGESSYHIDVSRWDEGAENVFLMGDEDLWGDYWWDTSEYPSCSARYGASQEPSAEAFSEEPAAAGGEAEMAVDAGAAPSPVPGEENEAALDSES